MSSVLRYILRFILLLLVQVFIVSKLELSTFIHPNVLLLFLISLPLNTGKMTTLFIGFVTGLLLDINMDSAGFNSTSFLVAAYFRVYYLDHFAEVEVKESSAEPNFSSVNLRWYLSLASIIVLSHHLVYSFIEGFRLRFIGYNLLTTLSSSVASIVLILLFQSLFFRIRKGDHA